jgi:hypothetical protein
MSDLEDCEESFQYLLETAVDSLGQRPEADIPHQTVEMSQRILGICALLAQGDAAGFVERLDRSGTARLRLLELKRRGVACNPQIMTASKSVGFFAALASGNLELGTLIARLLPAAHDPSWEYEEDFLFADFLRHVILGLAGDQTWRQTAAATLTRWEEVLEGRPSTQMEVCRAFLSTDPAALAGPFAGFIQHRADQLEEYRNEVAFDRQAFAAEGQVYIEGFAVLELASRLQLVALPPDAVDPPLLPALGRAERSRRAGPSPDWLVV